MASIDVELDEVLDGSSDKEIIRCFSSLHSKLQEQIINAYCPGIPAAPSENIKDLIDAFRGRDAVQFEIILNRIWPEQSLETTCTLRKVAA